MSGDINQEKQPKTFHEHTQIIKKANRHKIPNQDGC